MIHVAALLNQFKSGSTKGREFTVSLDHSITPLIKAVMAKWWINVF